MTDQLDTPREVLRASDNKVMWTWFSIPFGLDAPNENPEFAGTFIYDLRFPGQIAGSWGRFISNGYRDYDPSIGRYVESDPIGLNGGLNTYSYVYANPTNLADPTGLLAPSEAAIERALARAGVAEGAGGGPEDPFADLAALTALVYTIVVAEPPANDDSFHQSSCPPDDRCVINQKLLAARRADIASLRGKSIYYYGAARDFNREARIHNQLCPHHQVLLLPL